MFELLIVIREQDYREYQLRLDSKHIEIEDYRHYQIDIAKVSSRARCLFFLLQSCIQEDKQCNGSHSIYCHYSGDRATIRT